MPIIPIAPDASAGTGHFNPPDTYSASLLLLAIGIFFPEHRKLIALAKYQGYRPAPNC
jgi:hypothetical protein